MSLRPDDDSADSDPLLLFATEPQSVAAPAPTPEIPKKTEPVPMSTDLAALIKRADAAERALRESRREAAALKRQVATLVTAAEDNRARSRKPVVTLGLAAACLLAVMTVGWRFIPAGVPPTVVAAAEPASPQVVEPQPILAPAPVAEVAAPVSLPRRDVAARAQERFQPARTQRFDPEPRAQFVGTLSVDAVPAGGEVFINRKSVGTAPVRLSGLRAGSHLVWIQRAGYRRFTRVVTVPADQVSRVSVALEPENISVVRP